ncbi:NADPH-dependent FMN reductase [Saccharothrix sp. NRRL B-16348]|uniref:FMN reductase n=1 Tax=Saccharothrix sp. NRRL B-16348 TaxID=1415542 RepID=UPI0006AF1523|nr:FMN reductase [Saccharothrix sp. NRRL B-16348]KOX14474.1 NADPH-dependent FMN reductase [Saccharothrix sp. NRRL B-16348]
MTTLAVVQAGLGSPSSTQLLATRLAEAVQRLVPDLEVRTVHLRDVARDIADNLVTGFPSARLREVVESVVGADAVIAVTPTFNASYSGLFKSFVDVLEPESLAGKPVLIGATGGTERHSLVLDHALRPLFAYLRAVVVPTGVYAASSDWGAEGLPGRVDRAAGELADLLVGRAPAKPVDDGFVPFDQLLAGR